MTTTMRKGAVMLTLDGSEFADEAIEHAKTLAIAMGSKVVLLDVLPDHRGPAAFSIDGARYSDRRDATAHLLGVKQRLNEAGVSEVELLEIENSSAGEAIVESARRLECDAVVMATHGRGGFKRMLGGSVAEHVVRHLTGTPVVLIHPDAA